MLKELNSEKIQYLASRIANLSVGTFGLDQLGSLALEILITRNKIEDVLEGKGSKEEKKHAQKVLEQLKHLEKSIIQLYLLNKLRKQGSDDYFLDYITRRYSFMEEE